jgi:hypothetical protein
MNKIANPVPFPLLVGPLSVRVFAGYRLPTLAREAFLKELGETFMPGTPNMLAPLGLAAYLPAVLDFEDDSGLPDEVALIVYSSRGAYEAARRDSLQGRMYTHSHAGIFDMGRSRGQWPGPLSSPGQLENSDRWSWFAFDRAIDWQEGITRVLFLSGVPASGDLQATLVQEANQLLPTLSEAGVNQAIFLASSTYAAIWLHGHDSIGLDATEIGLVPDGTELVRDMVAIPVPMPTGIEGPSITGPGAFSFRFVRDLRFFL